LGLTVGYEILPHTTDAYIQTCGATLEEAFAYAALALFDTMCNVNSVSKSMSERVLIRGVNELALLYDWLEALLLKFELEGKVYSSFDVRKVTHEREGLELDANISGEMYDKNKHGAKVEVKAVTFHKMEILTTSSSTILRFILDL
jgi:SHS2 domain-containing protein